MHPIIATTEPTISAKVTLKQVVNLYTTIMIAHKLENRLAWLIIVKADPHDKKTYIPISPNDVHKKSVVIFIGCSFIV